MSPHPESVLSRSPPRDAKLVHGEEHTRMLAERDGGS
jgi:hypothetical protein